MRKTLSFLAILLATAGCGGGDNEQRQSSTDLKTYDVNEPPPADPAMVEASGSDRSSNYAPPGISPTAAPGVAFNYRYAFRLQAARISAVQERHAAACEKLGLDRCRITGMRYRLVNDRDIEAMLAFKLDPAIARDFGKKGIDAVTEAEGMLVDSEISGEDVGSQIEAAGRSVAQMEEDLQRVEQQLARPGLKAPERAELQAQAQRLREAIRAARANREEKSETLAKTPMVFHYGSGDLAPGFDERPSVSEALADAGESFVRGLLWIVVALITLLPWALLAGLGLWAVLRVRRWVLRDTPAGPVTPPPPEA
jgi:hypothetical protein